MSFKKKLYSIRLIRSALTQEVNTEKKLTNRHFAALYLLRKIHTTYRKRLEQELAELRYWTGLNNTNYSSYSKFKEELQEIEPDEVWDFIRSEIGNVEVLIDLGSGVRPTNVCTPRIHLNVEKWHPYNVHLSKRYPKSNLIQVEMDALEFLQIQPDSSLDTIIAFDIIEHFTKDLGWKLIQEIQRTTKNTAIIFTPNGFMEQHVSENDSEGWGWTGNILQNHLSGWTAQDFLNWNCTVSHDYHKLHGFEDGALVAVYKPKKVLFEESNTVVLMNLSENITENEWRELIEKIERTSSHSKISVIFHNGLAQGSHLILPNFEFPNWPAKYATFDPFVNQVESKLRWLIPGLSSDTLSILRRSNFAEIIYVGKKDSKTTNQYFQQKLKGEKFKQILI